MHDKDMRLRSTYPGYLNAVDRYFERVLELLVPLQSSYGGAIVAFQLENELAEYPQEEQESTQYLLYLYRVGTHL